MKVRPSLCPNWTKETTFPKGWQSSLHVEKKTDHCVNALRQTIQCYGSTTLIPTRFSTGPNLNYIDADQVHTCRSFDFLHDFVSLRKDGGENYVVRDQSLIGKGPA